MSKVHVKYERSDQSGSNFCWPPSSSCIAIVHGSVWQRRRDRKEEQKRIKDAAQVEAPNGICIGVDVA